MIEEVELSNKDRQRLKVLTRSVVSRLLPQTPELHGVLNRGENRAIRVLSSVPGLIAGGAVYFLLRQFQDVWAEWPVVGTLAEHSGSIIAALVVFLLFVFFNPLAGWLDNHFMRFWSGTYMFRHKWQQGEPAKKLLEAAENLIRTRPEKIIEALRDEASERAEPILPPKLMQKIKGFPGPDAPVAILIRKFTERRLKSHYLAARLKGRRGDEKDDWYSRRYFLRSRTVRNAIRTQLLFNEVGAELRAEIPAGYDWQRFYWSDPGAQESALFDSRDIHQRFRTAAPHYRWPVSTAKESVGETAIYRLVAAIENPMLQALYIVPVKDVIDHFPQVVHEFLKKEEDGVAEDDPRISELTSQYLDILQNIEVQMFGKWDHKTLRPISDVHINPQAILKNVGTAEAPDWLLRWDPNRIDWNFFDESDGTSRRAFAVLAEAIDQLGRDAKPTILKRGDALLVDNMRCLLARREVEPEKIGVLKRVALYPQSWWLRGYYGFRAPEAEPIVGHDELHPVPEALADAYQDRMAALPDAPGQALIEAQPADDEIEIGAVCDIELPAISEENPNAPLPVMGRASLPRRHLADRKKAK